MELIAYLFYIWLLCIIVILVVFANDLIALWREPMLTHPVLIIESDDWGAGPLSQVTALNRLTKTLSAYRDSMGRHPVMTIAINLAIADGPKIGLTDQYHRIMLNHQDQLPNLQAITAGIQSGIFSPQLHGREHYWPSALMSSDNSDVQAWLRQVEPQLVEKLPSHLQSRWIDATTLPSKQLDVGMIEEAAEEECAIYSVVTGKPARVAVPTTFVWNDAVEEAWSNHGVEFVVTPGVRFSCRDADGMPSCRGTSIRNGDSGKGVTYLVRNDYFEPEKGHSAEHAMMALKQKTSQARPCLLETHRSNFIGDSAEKAFAELDSLMRKAITIFPDLRFMDALELGKAVRDCSENIIEMGWQHRVQPWIFRLEQVPRFCKLARITGLMFLLRSLASITRPNLT